MDRRRKVLIVEDIELNREILEEMLKGQYEIITAENGKIALEKLEAHPDVSAVLLDLQMPVMTGYEVLEIMKKRGLMDQYPVIILTSNQEDEARCLDYGVCDFINKPFDVIRGGLRLKNGIALYESRNHLDQIVKAQTEELRMQNEQLHQINEEIIELLAETVDLRDRESGLHIHRVKAFTRILAEDVKLHFPEYGLDDDAVDKIASASVLHDVGKLLITDAILLKPGKLTDEEFEVMRSHTVLGCQVLDNAHGVWNEEYDRYAREICACHHERWDGRGYPKHLMGDDIPICAQIVALADVYDALVTERVYKKPFPPEKAYDMISHGECGTFSPKMLESFARCRVAMERQIGQ